MSYQAAYNPEFGPLGYAVSQRWPEASVIAAKGKRRETIGLALSGGGYRSAIFCYGVLRGLHELGLLPRIDYLSVVSGGSWIGTPFSMAEAPERFFHYSENQPNFIEEGFESLLPNPLRVLEEAALVREEENRISNIYGRLLAKNFLREHGDYARWGQLSDASLIRDTERPFLIVNGTVNFRRSDSFDVTQECFEMTRLYCGSRSLGFTDTASLRAVERPIRIRDAIAISGAAVAAHVPGLGEEVKGIGLSREVDNYARRELSGRDGKGTSAERLDVADGGHYNNLGVEALIGRGCRYLIVVDAEFDPESKDDKRSHQRYGGLRTLQKRKNVPLPEIAIEELDRADACVQEFRGGPQTPDVLYLKLKSLSAFDADAAKRSFNRPGFRSHLFGHGPFSFNPQFNTAKLDYSFAEHRNLSDLGHFMVMHEEASVAGFCERAG